MIKKRTLNNLVYSSEHGRMCPSCGKPLTGCLCRRRTRSATPGDGVVRVCRETKGRKGKGVTLINGVPLPPDQLKALLKEIKQKCGCGGTLKDGVIEIQGDRRDDLIVLLEARGYIVKRAGG